MWSNMWFLCATLQPWSDGVDGHFMFLRVFCHDETRQSLLIDGSLCLFPTLQNLSIRIYKFACYRCNMNLEEILDHILKQTTIITFVLCNAHPPDSSRNLRKRSSYLFFLSTKPSSDIKMLRDKFVDGLSPEKSMSKQDQHAPGLYTTHPLSTTQLHNLPSSQDKRASCNHKYVLDGSCSFVCSQHPQVRRYYLLLLHSKSKG